MKRKLDPALIQRLVETKSYQQFLQVLLEPRGASAQLARRAGFNSRSYLSELMAGKKGLSQDSFNRIKTGMGLPRSLTQLFEALVYQSESQLRPARYSSEQIHDLISQALREIKTQPSPGNSELARACVRSPQVFQIYAALGLPSEGATLEEIMLRTSLSARQVKVHLKKLLERNIIVHQADRYYAPVSQADHLGIHETEDLSEMVKLVTQDIQKSRNEILKDANSLTVYSAFSVQKRNLPELKKKLQAAIYGVLDEYQDDRGNNVQQIFISLHGNPLQD